MVAIRLCSASVRCRAPLVHQRPRAPLFAQRRSSSYAADVKQSKEGRSLLSGPACRQRHHVLVAATGGQDTRADRQQRALDRKIILGLCLSLTGIICSVAYLGGDSFLELATWEGLDFGPDFSLGVSDLVGALLWSISLYFASPWQLLLLFLGKIETERPSDGVLRFFGQLGGLRVDDIDYRAPGWVKAATVAVFGLSGFGIAAALGTWLGDASWSVSTGLGSCVAAGMYEVGRPQRLSVEEAQLLELQWRDFEAFADERLQKAGRCHESEIIRGFRRTKGRYRQATGPSSVISDMSIRDMIRNWHPTADRTGSGYYKNLSLRQPGQEGSSQSEEAGAGSSSG